MKIGLIDIDSKMPNLALMKLSAYYKKVFKYKVELTGPLFAKNYDIVFASKIFTYSYMPIMEEWINIGGSGISLKTKLKYQIEHMMPDYSLGFTTRGCHRKCQFCIVPKKEGKIKVNADIYEFWNKKHKKIMLLDNNIFSMPDHFFKITEQIRKEGLKVDFNQGLDHRLLTNAICKRLSEIKHEEYRFSFDDIKQKKAIFRSLKILEKHGIKRSLWYVLVGFNSTIEEDLYRLNLLRDFGQTAYVQRYNYVQDDVYIAIATWANQHNVFRGLTFRQYLNHPEGQKYQNLYRGIDIGK